MALPTQLTNIPVDNDYSMDEAAIIEQLISSGQLSVSQVSDYFGLPAADINRVLSQDFGYTPEQVAQVAAPSPLTGVTANAPAQSTLNIGNTFQEPDLPPVMGPLPPASYVPPVQPTLTVAPTNTAAQTNVPAAISNIPLDGNYSEADAIAVENAIKSGQVTTQQVSDYFNVPVADINRVLETDFGYTPEQTAQAVTGLTPSATETTPAATETATTTETTVTLPEALTSIPVDGNYSMADAEIVEGLIRSGQVTTQQVADRFGLPVNDINRVLSTDFGYTGDQITQASSGGGVQGEVTRPATQTTQGTQGTQGGQTTTNEPTVGGLAGRTVGGAASQNVFAPIAGQPATGNQFTFPTGGANMPQTGVIGAEAALQGGLAGGLAGLQQGIGEARTGLVGSSQQALEQLQTNLGGSATALGQSSQEALRQLQAGLGAGATGLTQATASGLQELRGALGQGRQDISAGFGRAEQGFQPYMQGGQAAQAQLEALSGVRGQDAFNQAYQESPYMAFLREQGMRANLAGAAATGGLGGGNVQKELARFGQGLASQGLQQQIQNLQGLTGQGLQAASGAGQYASGGAGQLANLSQLQGTQALGAMQNVGQGLAGLGQVAGTQGANIAQTMGQGLAGLGQVAGTQGAGIMQNVGNQLANLGLAGGQTAAQMGYGTGQNLADIRTRAGELMAGEISNVSRDVSGLASALGGDISGVYGAQSKNLADLLVQSGMAQADATRISAQLLANIATGASGQVAGLGTSVGSPTQTQGIIDGVGKAASGVGSLIALSDIRAKENISKIGQLPSGLGLYSWDWKESAPDDAKNNPTVGVIAQEVQQLIPDAIVQREDGYMAVDYSKVN
jgi:hypothetical protein